MRTAVWKAFQLRAEFLSVCKLLRPEVYPSDEPKQNVVLVRRLPFRRSLVRRLQFRESLVRRLPFRRTKLLELSRSFTFFFLLEIEHAVHDSDENIWKTLENISK